SRGDRSPQLGSDLEANCASRIGRGWKNVRPHRHARVDDARGGAKPARGARAQGRRVGVEEDRLRGRRGRSRIEARQGALPRRRGPGRGAVSRISEEGLMQKKLTKAVFPVAGLGSRFLPVTKASPKEMLPVVNKP